ncbi:hypothetical protein [Mycobacterium parmense]|uniref:Uncharacterized protein n=1 Tax=Mycobacterium parmense TaxID=185642 RepID=A0A7I7YRE8_9MYCO|nr:hypothetical protein [Mycobacterium parmense]MCV7349618.1 hypothetical protein [Mycobacterium parmense]ORW58901.1 hypothetical protein AWC20_11265 [Mycobacterium parmense]BBZ43744.1 hypothetical protein MPRM_10250 [Mycobacterium parmense]
MSDELTLLRIVAMKGGVSAETIAGCVGADATAVREALDGFTGRGLVKMTPMGYRITPSGRERCTELVTTERRSADQGAVAGVYGKFREHNRELKAVITDWQTRGADEPNDHSDAEYDRRVIERLLAVHQAVVPLVDQIAGLAPRLGHYRRRLDRAAEAVVAGDYSFVSRPLVDSYHTVWFELHEDLIGLAGLNRADEARSGHAG